MKLSTDILRLEYALLHDLREIAKSCENILIWAKDKESTEDSNIFKFDNKQLQALIDLVYTAKSEGLTSQNTKDWLKDYAREIEIKQEILNGL